MGKSQNDRLETMWNSPFLRRRAALVSGTHRDNWPKGGVELGVNVYTILVPVVPGQGRAEVSGYGAFNLRNKFAQY